MRARCSFVTGKGIGMNESLDAKKCKRQFITLIVLYLIIWITQLVFPSIFERYFFANPYITVSAIMGTVNILLIMINVCMVTLDYKGYMTAMLLNGCNLLGVIIKLVVTNDLSTMPGCIMLIANAAIIQIIHNYAKKVENKEKLLYDMAHTDMLTELPNRRSLKKKLEKVLTDAKQNNKKFAVVMIDLDNFKNVNDTAGHESGDAVLTKVSMKWRELLNANDFLARLGGDEFALIMYDYESLTELDEKMKSMMGIFDSEFILVGKSYYLSASMGVSLFPGDSEDISKLLRYSDMAMYTAKNGGKNRICYYDSIMNDLIENSVQMEGIIRHALNVNAFNVVYQPQYCANNKELRGFEALIRMQDADGKTVSPGKFIPVAEKSSLIIDIDKWVLDNALAEFKPYLKNNDNLILSINISATHMLDKAFLDDLDSVIAKYDFPVKNLELELTESVFVDSLDKAREIMNAVKERGIHIALDDFGTGYSSLSYLRELPIDLLKIDKSFIDSIKNDPKEEAFVEAIISLSQHMQFTVISEGVEEDYQLKILQKMGCDYIQGFLWGKPQKLTEFTGFNK